MKEKSLKSLYNFDVLNEAVEISGSKMFVYHLTGSDRFRTYSRSVKFASERMRPKRPKKSEDKARSILNTIEYKSSLGYSKKPAKEEVELLGITDLLADPFTKGTGFTPGGGDMYGPGLYTCFDFNPQIAAVYGDICLKFEVDISNYIIFFEDLAKQIHGDDWKIEDQVAKLFRLKPLSTDSAEIEAVKKEIISFCSEITGKIIGKSFNNPDHLTSSSAYKFTNFVRAKYSSAFLTSFFDGIIFRGRRDGPVCVIYNPQRKAEIYQIGRVSKTTTEVDWKNSLKEFFPSQQTIDINFKTLNDISNENDTDEIEFQENQQRQLEELIPSFNAVKDLKNSADDSEKFELILQSILDDINIDRKVIQPIIINSAFNALYDKQVYDIANSNMKRSYKVSKLYNLDIREMNHLSIKSLDLLTEIALKSNYFDKTEDTASYSLFVYALSSPINSESNIADYEKYAKIYLDNTKKVSLDIVMSIPKIYKETGKSFFSREIFDRLINTPNNKIQDSVNVRREAFIHEIVAFNDYSSKLGMSEDDVLALFEKIISINYTDMKKIKFEICLYGTGRNSLCDNLAIQSRVAEIIRSMTSTMLADTISVSSDGLFRVLFNDDEYLTYDLVVNALADAFMNNFDKLSQSNKLKIENLFSNRKVSQKALSFIKNKNFIRYFNQINEKNSDWKGAIDKLKECQSVLEVDKSFKVFSRELISSQEFIDALIRGINDGTIIPSVSLLTTFLLNIKNYKPEIDGLLVALKHTYERINEKPNKPASYKSLMNFLFRAYYRADIATDVKLLDFIKLLPVKLIENCAIGTFMPVEGQNPLFEVIVFDTSLMSKIFDDMPIPTVSFIIKGLESNVKMINSYYKDKYVPITGILKFIDHISHNIELSPALKRKIESIRMHISERQANDANISDALIREYISLMLN